MRDEISRGKEGKKGKRRGERAKKRRERRKVEIGKVKILSENE